MNNKNFSKTLQAHKTVRLIDSWIRSNKVIEGYCDIKLTADCLLIDTSIGPMTVPLQEYLQLGPKPMYNYMKTKIMCAVEVYDKKKYLERSLKHSLDQLAYSHLNIEIQFCDDRMYLIMRTKNRSSVILNYYNDIVAAAYLRDRISECLKAMQ